MFLLRASPAPIMYFLFLLTRRRFVEERDLIAYDFDLLRVKMESGDLSPTAVSRPLLRQLCQLQHY